MVIIVGFLVCCRQVKEEHRRTVTHTENLLKLTNDQVLQAGITTCRFKKKIISCTVPCVGTIEADPNEQALVCVPLRGYLKKFCTQTGDYVSAGEPLAILEHPEYIKIQQEYLATKSQYDYDKKDFARQGELTLENATSLKRMQQAQNEFLKTESEFYSLKQQLVLLGIEPDSLSVENMTSEIELLSPVSGYVTKVNGQIGMLCTEEIPIFQIVGARNPHLLITADTKYLYEITSGQIINFSLTNRPNVVFKAKIKAVTRSDKDDKSLLIRAEILTPYDRIMPGTNINALIPAFTDSVYTLPNEAVISAQDKKYIFMKTDEGIFELLEVQTGMNNDSITEITGMNSDIFSAEIVRFGAGFLFSEMNKSKYIP
jgi:cobalt-zinc-cadmium efflux system membrane fusion protein